MFEKFGNYRFRGVCVFLINFVYNHLVCGNSLLVWLLGLIDMLKMLVCLDLKTDAYIMIKGLIECKNTTISSIYVVMQ